MTRLPSMAKARAAGAVARAFSRGVVSVVILSSSAALLSCGASGPYTWVKDLPDVARARQEYVVREGDLLDVRVYNEPTISTRARVRADGKITVSLVGDVTAAGKTPSTLGKEIQGRMQRFLNAPSVTIAVDESQPLTVTVVGEVGKAGVFSLPPDAGVLQALASAGGLSEYADDESIFVVRRTPKQRIRFTYEGLVDNNDRAAEFTLRNGDLITVE